MCTVRDKQLDVKNCFYRIGGKGVARGRTWRIHFYLVLRKRRGEVLQKDLDSTKNSKELLVEWEQPRFQLLKARSLVELNPRVKGNSVFLVRGEPLIFSSKTP